MAQLKLRTAHVRVGQQLWSAPWAEPPGPPSAQDCGWSSVVLGDRQQDGRLTPCAQLHVFKKEKAPFLTNGKSRLGHAAVWAGGVARGCIAGCCWPVCATALPGSLRSRGSGGGLRRRPSRTGPGLQSERLAQGTFLLLEQIGPGAPAGAGSVRNQLPQGGLPVPPSGAHTASEVPSGRELMQQAGVRGRLDQPGADECPSHPFSKE